MNWLDLVILLVLAWFVIAGATAGLVRESVTLIAVLLGVVLAGLSRSSAADSLDPRWLGGTVLAGALCWTLALVTELAREVPRDSLDDTPRGSSAERLTDGEVRR